MRDGWRDIYTELLLPILSSRSRGVPTLAPPCKLVRDASGRMRVPRSNAILCTLSKFARVVLITWSPSGYTPVRPECPEHTFLFTNHVTVFKAHGVTRNEPKIHSMLYNNITRHETPEESRWLHWPKCHIYNKWLQLSEYTK